MERFDEVSKLLYCVAHLAGITRENLAWDVPKDRGIIDRTRVQALELLLRLREL